MNNIVPSDFDGAYNIRVNGVCEGKEETKNVKIENKKDSSGLNIYINKNTIDNKVYIPVILNKEGFKDKVVNDFFIGSDSKVIINSECFVHNDSRKTSQHDGVHTFYLEKGSNVIYIENHYAEGENENNKVLNSEAIFYLKKKSSLEIKSSQMKGVTSSIRKIVAYLEDDATIIVNDKVFTSEKETSKSIFEITLDGKNSSAKITSRSVAEGESGQEFISIVNGNNKCFAHVECDALIKDKARAISTPAINANTKEARLIHEATIGKIAKEELIKLMSLGLSSKEAEEKIIDGFLK